MTDRVAEISAEIDRLKADLGEARAALPAHSVRPWQLQRVEDLEEEIEALVRELKSLNNSE